MPSAVSDECKGERVAKLLARAGIASRREIERMIAEGRIARNGVAIGTPATLLASLEGVTVDGARVEAPAPARLFLFHKPAGVLTAERDFSGGPTIYDRLPKGLPRLVPVGRLDLNTEGLLLMTNDGGLKRELELPANGIERAYRARAYGRVTQAQLEDLMDGIEIDGVRYGSIDANLERRTGANVWIEMVLKEGKNREVRRVLEHLGLRVSRLIRTRYGPFLLGDLPAGGIGEVRRQDLATFRQALGRKDKLEGAIAARALEREPAKPRPQVEPAPGKRPVRPASKLAAGEKPRAAPGRAHPRAHAEKVSAPASGQEAGQSAPPSRPPRPPARKAGWARPKPRLGAGPRRR